MECSCREFPERECSAETHFTSKSSKIVQKDRIQIKEKPPDEVDKNDCDKDTSKTDDGFKQVNYNRKLKKSDWKPLHSTSFL